jgi:chitinase
VLGYYVAYQRDQYPPEAIHWPGLTHVVMGRVKANADASLALDFDWDAVNGPKLAREIAARAHAAGKRALLMLGGESQGAAIRSATSPARRQTFVQNLLNAVKDLGYDGLDLDWEDDIDWSQFIALAKELRAAAPGLTLTVPGGAINPNVAGVPREVTDLVRSLDRYNLMSYYPATAVAGWGWLSWHNSALDGAKPNTPVTIRDSLERYVKAGVPKRKLGMGIAFYAICYSGSVTAPNQSTEGVSILGGDNDYPLSLLFGTSGAYAEEHRRWDSNARAAYLSLPSPDVNGCRYVSFEDEESIRAKGAFSKAEGYGGTIVWTINQGYVATRPQRAQFLMEALRQGFLE